MQERILRGVIWGTGFTIGSAVAVAVFNRNLRKEVTQNHREFQEAFKATNKIK